MAVEWRQVRTILYDYMWQQGESCAVTYAYVAVGAAGGRLFMPRVTIWHAARDPVSDIICQNPFGT